MSASTFIAVGRIVKPHGLDGDVLVEVWSDFPERFVPGLRLAVEDPPKELVEGLVVESVRPHQGRLRIRFEGFDDVTTAEGLRGLVLGVSQAEAPPRPEGYVFHHEIQGCEAVDPAGVALGVVKDLVDVGGRALLVLSTESGERDVPFTHPIVVSVDLPARRIVLDPPPGLLS